MLLLLWRPQLLFAYIIEDPDPSPFRRTDEISGRSYRYDRDTFLHRFTYRYHPDAARTWQQSREGLRTTVGSVKTNEAYVKMQVYKTVAFDLPTQVTYRFMRDEDFDGRYDRNLIGLGVRFPEQWSLTVLSDIVAAKENIDAHIELEKNFAAGHYMRLGLVAVDLTYNHKQNDDTYTSYPFTYFAQARWQENNRFLLHGYLNYNAPLRLEMPLQEFTFGYQQLTGGAELSRRFDNGRELFASFKAEHGTRDRWSTALIPHDERHFFRRYAESTLQLTQNTAPDVDVWLGGRYVGLFEWDRRPLAGEQERRERRREHMLYAGINWRFRDNALFWPGVYANFINNRIDYPLTGMLEEAQKRWYGKLALPLELTFGPSATITFNLTLRLHRLIFGGLNFQAGVPL